MSCKGKVITSEYVSWGHPDKLADRIADEILFEYASSDPNTRAGIEVLVKDNVVVLGGEIASRAPSVNHARCARGVIANTRYPHNHNLDNIKVIDLIGHQSKEINVMVDREDGVIGAGDQGFCVGYASSETSCFMPLGHYIARMICLHVCETEFGPDVKTQVVVSYDENENATVDYILVSAMHPEGELKNLRNAVKADIMFNACNIEYKVYNKYIQGKNIKIDVNPCGAWTIGGPVSDCGVTGRKIVVDQFGGYCNVGGGAFSGKDFSKVDRSGAYLARYLAKNIVATGICENAKVELSYVIGKPQPCALNIELNRNCEIVDILKSWLIQNVDMSPSGIIKRFVGDDNTVINYPLYAKYGSYGYSYSEVGNTFPWEKLDLYKGLSEFLKHTL